MEILDILVTPNPVIKSSSFSITFSIIGAKEQDYFSFPFSNESLSEPKLQFKSKQGD